MYGHSASTRRRSRRAIQAGLEIRHSLGLGRPGRHVSYRPINRARTTSQYLATLRTSAALGGHILVFGSPKQRNVMDGVTYGQAFDFAVEVFEKAMPAFAERGVTLCMEPLATTETNFCKNAAETVTLIERINHPNFQVLLDTKAMTDEPEGRPATIRKHAKYLKHYHANDANLEGPGFGDVDFAPIFQALHDIQFADASVEVFCPIARDN